MKTEKVIIGSSDYTKEQMVAGDDVWAIGSTSKDFLDRIELYEKSGYTVKFETSLLRRIFGTGIYKVVAYPTQAI